MSPPDPWSMLIDRLNSIDSRLNKIETHLGSINGDIEDLKLWRATLKGAAHTVRWLPGFLVAIAASAVGAVLITVLH